MSASHRNEMFKNAKFRQVSDFAAYLDGLISARTSLDGLRRAAGVGKTKLPDYLNGTHVPDLRVLRHWIIEPLSSYRPLREEEWAKLLALHEAAAAVQPPKEPTLSDQITFMREDLQQANLKIATLSRRLEAAISKNLAGDAAMQRMRRIQEEMRNQLLQLTAEANTLMQELERSRTEYQEALKGANRRFAEFGEEKRRKLAEYQERISRLEVAVAGHLEKEVELRRYAASLEATVDRLKQQIKDERALYMKLVAHITRSTSLLKGDQEREREREAAQAEIRKLVLANERLTETLREDRERIEQLTMELVLLQAASPYPTQERRDPDPPSELKEAG